MINEPSAFDSSRGPAGPLPPKETPTPLDPVRAQLQEAVSTVMQISRADLHTPPPMSGRFIGRLRVGSEMAYAHLDSIFAPLDHHVVLTTDEGDEHVILAIKGRIRPRPRPIWPNIVLLILTVLSLLFVGASQDAVLQEGESLPLSSIWRGWPYALSVLLILGAHELGHYFAARFHGVHVTLPYFIPLPLGFFGTLGAFIQLREPVRNRKILFDVGVAGPLAGFLLAVPILFIGLATSDVTPLPADGYILEGDSLLYGLAKFIVFGQMLPNGHEDVLINQVAKAGWMGLFITGLNLIPVGQLDGGHVVSTLLGRRAQRLYLPVLGVFLILSFLNSMWLLWTMLLFLLGRLYAMPLDAITPLDPRRRRLGYAALLIFVLVFVPNPLQIVQP
ncbi:MAG: site-2 protease family protein [Anaerolineae bacterium]|nr:site-2 protease family protein [Anaerolineae bacterium]